MNEVKLHNERGNRAWFLVANGVANIGTLTLKYSKWKSN